MEVGLAGRSELGGYSSEVEPQPSKLVARVRFPLPAPFSIPHTDGKRKSDNKIKKVHLTAGLDGNVLARLAQAVEHFIGNEEVPGSTPGVSTRIDSVT